MRWNLLFVFVLLFVHVSLGQDIKFVRDVAPCPVTSYGGSLLEMPFTGGFNRPIHQFLDLDGDQDLDLVVQDQAHLLSFYENEGTVSDYRFRWVNSSLNDIKLGDWFKFADPDNDGDMDLFVENPYGIIRYYQNVGSKIAYQFELAADTLRDDQGKMIFTDGFSIPSWTDIDADQQLELFLGRQSGHIALYDYAGLNSNSVPVYKLVTERFQDLQIVTGGKGNNVSNGLRHGANSLTFVDIDNDQDFDCFWGDFYAESMIFIENTGTKHDAIFTTNNILDNYPIDDPIVTGGFNVPSFADIDADGDKDMFVGVYGGAGSLVRDLEENFYFYENRGTVETASFQLITKKFITSVDIGQGSKPFLVDIDNDNDFDLFIANQEDLRSPGRNNSRIHFFENRGSSTDARFELNSSHYLGEDLALELNYAPAFVDLNGDGALDLVLGNWAGELIFCENVGTPEVAQFIRVEEHFAGVDVGNYSTPAFADIDADNDFDLFVGGFAGKLQYYENIGDSSRPEFFLQSTNYMNVDVFKYSAPTFADLNGDGDLDLIVGSLKDGNRFYRNIGTRTSAQFVLDSTIFQGPKFFNSAPGFADIDGDGDTDLFLGSASGGIIFYENSQPANSVGMIVEPGEINFGEIDAGASATAIISLTNLLSEESVIILEFSPTSEHGYFDLETNEITVQPGQSSQVTVYFHPLKSGKFETSLITINARDTLKVGLLGKAAGNITPRGFQLYQNYPNPFNSGTIIPYNLPEEPDLGTSSFQLTIYNVLGQKIRSWDLSNSPLNQQLFWDGRDTGGRMIPSGIYFYQLHSGNYERKIKSMLLVR